MSGHLPPPPAAVPGPRSAELLAAYEKVFYPGLVGDGYPFVARSKAGWTITDVDGNTFVDLVSASASVPVGAGRADLVRPAAEALLAFGNEDSHAVFHEAMLPLANRLLALAPNGLTRVDISLNGTESVETAVRVMRRATGRPVIIGFLGGYHGETTTTASLGAEQHEIGRNLRGLASGFVHVPYPNTYRSPFAPARPGGTGDPTVDFLRDHVLFHLVDPSEVAGVLIEPVLGSGGVVVPPETFWPALSELCRQHDWLLCLDEVKTGFGRTGEMFAADLWGVQPDLMCLGKAMGGGVMPIGALLGGERALSGFSDLATGSTWSWLPAACAAALAYLDVLENEDVLGNVRALHQVSTSLLGPLEQRIPEVGDVRVQGGFAAVEFVADPATKERFPVLQDAVAEGCLRRGVLVASSTTSLNIQPSLVMSPEAYAEALTRVLDAIDEAVQGIR
ncbi:aspartate aminotransferase family protein [Mycolicibacterium sp.]|uniref:class-III pyridoxal-phosphate-dependent aminotransferase n=1 Tax=Mycolicibacterium sp. TaxID=2320850 RepID=UPI003D10B265